MLHCRIIELLVLASCLAGAVGCASHPLLRTRQIDYVPSGQYAVTVAEDPRGSQKYDAVLFETAPASVTLDLPRVSRRGIAKPDDYREVLRAGFIVYELRSAAGVVTGYLMAPARAQVVFWDRGGRDGLVVTVTELPSAPESGGGGTGGM